ncbi:MAG: septum formation initiator family protein [Lachnospiraceae bacterium]|nr:septum formation initiator family protein [Lachnospiraceae bacterium]MDN4744672.1 septum formation initiator family protein [Lachnospiraceae bacterium C1.1]
MGRVPAFQRKKHNKLSVLCIIIVMIMLLGVVAYDSFRLQIKQEQYISRINELEKGIEDEKKRTEDLKEFEKYTKTRKYAEEIAEDKLGLVHDGEIVFKPEDEDK